MSRATVGTWGKSLAVRLPAEVARQAGFKAGTSIDVVAADGKIELRPSRPKLTLEELFRGKTPEEWRELYRDSYDWGPDVGREIIDE